MFCINLTYPRPCLLIHRVIGMLGVVQLLLA